MAEFVCIPLLSACASTICILLSLSAQRETLHYLLRRAAVGSCYNMSLRVLMYGLDYLKWLDARGESRQVWVSKGEQGKRQSEPGEIGESSLNLEAGAINRLYN